MTLHSGDPDPAEPEASKALPFSTIIHEIVFVITISSGQLLTQAALGQVIAPLHIIGKTFGVTSPGQLSWFVAAYSLTVGTFILIAGRLGDIFGYKPMFILGFIWFGFWSLVAGISAWSSSQIFFDICRALQGIAPAAILPNALAILGRIYPPGGRKAMIFSLFGATAPGGFVLGATFAAIFADLVWWPWAFWVMAIVCFIVALIALFVIPRIEKPDTGSNWVQQFDFGGSITGVTGLVCINFAWNQGPTVGWDKPYVYVILIIGFLFMALFALAEWKAVRPLLPREVLKFETGFVLACIAAGWSSFGIWLFYLWQFIEELRGQTPLSGAAQLAPAAISGACAAVTTGFLVQRLPASLIMVFSMSAFAAGNILLATMPVGQIYWAQTLLSVIVTCWGMDMSFPAATLIVSDSVGGQHQGIAASLVNTVVNYSISIGLGIAGTVTSRLDHGGRDLLRGYRSAWYTGIGLSGSGVVIAILFVVMTRKREKVNQPPA